jgi:glutamate synthase domain-containing protein 3
MPEEKELSPAQKKALKDQTMAKAAIKTAILSFNAKKNENPPEPLVSYWNLLSRDDWTHHLELFEKYLKNYNQVKIKQLLFDLEHYLKDCKKVIPRFSKNQSEILLLVAIGKIQVRDFIQHIDNIASNREKLDRDIQRKIKTLNWQDLSDLDKLDDLTKQLDKPNLKKAEIQKIDEQIDLIEAAIKQRREERSQLALKLVEWKARGNIDIINANGSKLEA